jgi:hypothetical protein
MNQSNNNFGLYVAEDQEIITFYYKDIFKNIQLIYYTFSKDPVFDFSLSKSEFSDLKLVCVANPNTWLSTHSNDFKYYLK